jgi:phthiocerol/phenolphthiocerol synthesis type-I polyketide synthase D/polyketide synthase PksJ
MSVEKTKEIKQTIIDFICNELSVDVEDIDTEINLGAYGLGSMAATKLIGMLEDIYDLQLSPLLVFDYPTIDALSNIIGGTENA